MKFYSFDVGVFADVESVSRLVENILERVLSQSLVLTASLFAPTFFVILAQKFIVQIMKLLFAVPSLLQDTQARAAYML